MSFTAMINAQELALPHPSSLYRVDSELAVSVQKTHYSVCLSVMFGLLSLPWPEFLELILTQMLTDFELVL